MPPADVRSAVRRAVSGLCGATGCSYDEEALTDALLVASELTTNAILHGGGVTGFDVDVDGRAVRVSVSDRSDRLPIVAGGGDDQGDGVPAAAAGRSSAGWPATSGCPACPPAASASPLWSPCSEPPPRRDRPGTPTEDPAKCLSVGGVCSSRGRADGGSCFGPEARRRERFVRSGALHAPRLAGARPVANP